MNLLDLCSGIGGFSLAAHWLDWETVAFCERDKFCQKVLAKNFPGVEIYDDVYTFPSESFRGRVDVLTGGFPCQPFSAAGKRKGRDDERHLFPAILEIVRTVEPAYCVFENVRGLLSIENGAVFAEIVASLEGVGYEVITFCLPASALNAPHRRDRLWIVCRRAGSGAGELANAMCGRAVTHARADKRTKAILRRHDPSNVSAGSFQHASADADIGAAGSRNVGESDGTTFVESGTGDAPNAIGPRAGDQNESLANQRRAAGESGRTGIRRGNGTERPGGINATDCDAPDARREYESRNVEGMEACASERTASDIHAQRCDSQSAVKVGGGEDARYVKSTRQQGGIIGLREVQYGRTSPRVSGWSENWTEVAARFCRMDDELPNKLDESGARDNRVNRLKALGNAIVPAIAFEIFRAIQDTNESLY